ncbi:MAG: hypothetical protein H0T43_12860 [Solirubrobacterales bacterium]|nr:hypothetical protein [Solirubrobacterales bacterium]
MLLPGPGVGGEARAAGLSLGVPTPAVFGSPLGPSTPVESTGGSVSVTALAGWQVRVRGTDGGRLRSTGTGPCASGSTLLSNSLRVWAGGTGVSSPGSSANPLVLSDTAQVLASGNVLGLVALAVPVTVTYRYVPSAGDQLPASCPYSLTAIIDLSA